MKFSPTSSPPPWSNAPNPFVDKKHQTIATSLWLHLNFTFKPLQKPFGISKFGVLQGII